MKFFLHKNQATVTVEITDDLDVQVFTTSFDLVGIETEEDVKNICATALLRFEEAKKRKAKEIEELPEANAAVDAYINKIIGTFDDVALSELIAAQQSERDALRMQHETALKTFIQ